MATADARRRTTWGGRFRLLVRVLGLTGLVAFAAAAVVLSTVYGWPRTQAALEGTARSVWASASEGGGDTFTRAASVVLVAGLAAVAVALVVEVLGGLFLVAGRRTAGGFAAALATAAALALLVFVNLYSLSHHRQFDLTRDARFTLPPGVADELRQLSPDSPTTVVVFQQHKAGTLTGKPDGYDYAAERKVVEKVADLVDRFRAFGPRFRVAVLDVEDENYERQLADLARDGPALKAAVEAAPGNSIFFAADGRVQRLGFDEFLALDKTASREADGGRGNLVLLPQGVDRFARRVLAVQERRPKAAVCVVHGYLGTTGPDSFTLAGVKKALTDHGFDVTDIVLRQWQGARSLADLKPAAYTREESALEELEGDLEEAGTRVRAAREEAADLGRVKEAVAGPIGRAPFRDRVRNYVVLSEVAKNRGWLEVTGAYRKWAEGVSEQTEPGFRADLVAALEAQRVRAGQEAGEAEKARRAADDKLAAALKDERPIQDRRLTDVKAKLSRLLADVDLLIVPRFTIASVTGRGGVDPQLHALSPEQTEVVKGIMKAGKPVLALLGPTVGEDGPPAEPDGFEKLLAERGVELGRDVVLFDAEGRFLASFGAGSQFGGSGPADIPPLAVEDRSGGEKVAPNPIGEAVRAAARAGGQKLDVSARALRPVYVAPGWQAKLPFAAEFLLTGADSWNEARPFAEGDRAGRITYVPRYDPPAKAAARDDLSVDRAAERRGPFPVGVAVEGKPPAWWYDEAYTPEAAAAALLLPADGGLAAALTTAAAAKLDRPAGRVVVFGSGGLFTGPDLKPAQEKLLLHTANWLVNRPDRLPVASGPSWSFPRVGLSGRQTTLWRWGTAAGLPLLAVYFGLLAVLIRRRR